MRLNDLQNRIYKEKECTRFEYDIIGEQPEDNVTARFKRVDGAINTWNMQVVMEGTGYRESQVYSFSIEMPRRDASIILVCETGIRMLQMILKDEVQKKSALDFTIGQLVKVDNSDQEVI